MTSGPSVGTGAGPSRGGLHVLRIVLVLAGLLGGALLPSLTSQPGVLAMVVQGGYGALAGWAVGAVIAYLLGER